MLKKHALDPIKLIWLFAGSLIINTGVSFIWPLTTIYIHNYLHETLTVAGIVLFINSAFTMVGNAVGGLLFDKWHPYQTLLTGVSISTLSTFLLVLFHGWPSLSNFVNYFRLRQRYCSNWLKFNCYFNSKSECLLCV